MEMTAKSPLKTLKVPARRNGCRFIIKVSATVDHGTQYLLTGLNHRHG